MENKCTGCEHFGPKCLQPKDGKNLGEGLGCAKE